MPADQEMFLEASWNEVVAGMDYFLLKSRETGDKQLLGFRNIINLCFWRGVSNRFPYTLHGVFSSMLRVHQLRLGKRQNTNDKCKWDDIAWKPKPKISLVLFHLFMVF